MKGGPVQGRAPGRFTIWSALGLFWFVFQMWVWGRWVTGPYFKAVAPGSDPISDGMQLFLLVCQIVCPLLCLACVWRWVVVPWRREGRMSSDVMIVLASLTVWFWDFSPSFVVDQVTYNSHMFNRGSWGLHAWPGWVGPGGHLVAEPLLFVPPAYVVLVLSQVIFICWLLRRLKERQPQTSVLSIVATIVLGLFFLDSVIEMTFLRTGLYAYTTTVPALTLFAGQPYQFPLTEGFFFGGLALGAIGILKFFKDDRGQTFVEKGIDRLMVGQATKQLLRLSAIYGWIHTAFFALYMVPAMLFALNGGPYPKYPSYMKNGLCQY
ncbi:MAG TPA: spirocyclase AveC family protein, partial [Burkholderiaceae bacterium]|nr:spirocyclase AveC family protein [Burkholderiaceae bacterium]